MESLNLLRYLVIRDKVTENQVSFTALAAIQSIKYHDTLPAKRPKSVTLNDGLIYFEM